MSSKPAVIAEATATGEEISMIIEQVEPIFLQFPPDHCVIASLCMAATLMNPYATADEIQEVVMGASQYLCLALDGKGEMNVVPSGPKETMN